MAKLPLGMAGEQARQFAYKLGRQFVRPDDDWRPHLLMFNDSGVSVRPIDPIWVSTPAMKEGLAKVVLPDMVRVGRPTSVALVQSSWYYKGEADENGSLTDALRDMEFAEKHGVRNLPNKKEGVMIEAWDLNEYLIWVIPIIRSEIHPPRLGKMDKWDSSNMITFDSRWLPSVRAAMVPVG